MKLTPPLAQAFTNLRASGDFKVLMGALAEDMQAETQRALVTEGTPCHRAQGAALKLQEIMKLFVEAPTTLEKFNRQEKTP